MSNRSMVLFVLVGLSLLGFPPLLHSQAAGQNAERPQLVVQVGHRNSSVTSVVFSPDGRTMASGSLDSTIKLWDVATGGELRTLSGHEHGAASVMFSPDGKSLVSGGDVTLKLWDTASGQELRTFNGHEAAVLSVAFSPDGKAVASGSDDGTIKLWDVATGRELRTLSGHTGHVSSVTYSPDGQTLVSGSFDKTLRLWNVTSGRELRTLAGHTESVECVAISSDGKTVGTGSWDKTVKLWDLATGQILHTLSGHSGFVRSVAFSPDGKTLVSGDWRSVLKVWDVESGRALRTLAEDDDSGSGFTSVAFSPQGKIIVSGGETSTIKFWDVATGQKLRTITWRSQPVGSVLFSPDGKTVASGVVIGYETFKLWDVATGLEPRSLEWEMGWRSSLAFSPNGKTVASVSGESLQLWDLASGLELHTLAGHAEYVEGVAFSPDGRTLVSGSWDNTLKLWDVAGGRELHTLRGHTDDVTSVAFSPDGRTVVSGSSDRTLKLWDVANGRELRTLSQFRLWARSVAFSPDGKTVVSAGVDASIELWDLAAGTVLRTFTGHEGSVNRVAFSPDGRTLASGSDDRTLKLWDVGTGRELRTFVGDTEEITSVAFSPDGRTLASGSFSGGKIQLWRVADGDLLATVVPFSDGRWAVTDPDGRFDVADLESMPHLHWVMPDDPLTALPLEIFMRDYYEPRLLSRIMNGEAFTPVRALSGLKRIQPEVSISGVEPDPSRYGYVSVTVEAEGAVRSNTLKGPPIETAVHDLRLFRNGQLVGYVEGQLAQAGGKPFQHTFSVRLPSGKAPILFTAYAFNDDRVKSATAQTSYTPVKAIVAGKPRAYLITVGVNHHENPTWDLRYAANDARQIGQALLARLSGQRTYEAVVTIPLISDVAGRRLATKANLRTVLEVLAGRNADVSAIPGGEQLRQASPDDLVLISFSGHGYGEGGLFYLIPSDTGAGVARGVTPEITTHAISSDDLSRWLRHVDAGDLAMVIDACHSAASMGEQFKPGPMGSRGLGQLAFDKGMRILVASQADDVALESDLIKQGLLSFALVHDGLAGQQADYKPQDHRIMLEEWLSYGVSRVPSLAEEVQTGTVVAAHDPGDARGVVVVSEGRSMTKRVIQQPALFDFTKGRRDVVLEVELK